MPRSHRPVELHCPWRRRANRFVPPRPRPKSSPPTCSNGSVPVATCERMTSVNGRDCAGFNVTRSFRVSGIKAPERRPARWLDALRRDSASAPVDHIGDRRARRHVENQFAQFALRRTDGNIMRRLQSRPPTARKAAKSPRRKPASRSCTSRLRGFQPTHALPAGESTSVATVLLPLVCAARTRPAAKTHPRPDWRA